ncbi:MAG: ribonuclease P protein component [Rhodobacteraceae bacterium]|nr:ribonuclease P protein component [Paracoccaceae bacterium]
MTPPGASEAGANDAGAGMPPAVSSCLTVLRKRADFLRAARAKRVVRPGFVLQARRRAPDESATGVRIGFTCSKKVGNAVARNRAKRRLREIARQMLPGQGRPGWDYVLIGRSGHTADLPFDRLLNDLSTALTKLHGE